MATYNDNKLFVRTGFTVENEVAGIDKIAKQLAKINTESQKLGESVKSIEELFSKFGIAFEQSSGRVIASSKQTTTQLNEEAKRQTKNEEAEAKIRVVQAEAEAAAKKEAAKQASIVIKGEQTRLTEEHKTNEIAKQVKLADLKHNSD